MARGKNVLGTELQVCSNDPMTGWFRNGCCDTGPGDVGMHVICVRVTAEFLVFSQSRGNDLSTPNPMYDFPGLKPGDCWCLCAQRWVEALQAGVATQVKLEASHISSLEFADLEDLKKHALTDE